MRTGEYYRVKPVFSVEKGDVGRKLVGICVYVHPLRRFGVLEFKGVLGAVRESFWPEELTTQNRVDERKAKRYGL